MPDQWQEWTETNRRMWDERVPIHVRSEFYDVEGFKAGQPAVEPFEIDELGPLGGMRMAHLQCHFGLDTLDLVRLHPTLTAVGLDFSAPAVEAARTLAAELDLADRATFVHAEVADCVDVLGREQFDLLYTGKGALCWLPDLRLWADRCAELLKPGGWLYVCEFHPIGSALGEDAPVVARDYFSTEVETWDEPGTYADLSAPTVHNVGFEWNHPLPQIINAVLLAGFELRFFHEWDHTLFPLNRWLVKGDREHYHWPGRARVPLMFSLRAQKPSSSGRSGSRPGAGGSPPATG